MKNDLVLFSYMPVFSSILSFSGLMRLKRSCSENTMFIGRNLALVGLKFDLDLEIIWFNVSTSSEFRFQRKNRAPIFAFNIYSQWCVFDLYYELNLTESEKTAREEKRWSRRSGMEDRQHFYFLSCDRFRKKSRWLVARHLGMATFKRDET